MSRADCTFELNADITGFGVRVATYIQSLLFWCLITTQMYSEHHAVVKTATDFNFVAFVYLVAVFVQANTNQMNIVDAHIVYLVTILPIYTAPAVPMGSLYLGVKRVLMPLLGIPSKDLPVVFERSRNYWLLRIQLFITTLAAYILWVLWLTKLTGSQFTAAQGIGCSLDPGVMFWSFASKQQNMESFSQTIHTFGIVLSVIVGIGLLTDLILIVVGCIKCRLFSCKSRGSSIGGASESEDYEGNPALGDQNSNGGSGFKQVRDAARYGQHGGTVFSVMIGVALQSTLIAVIESILNMSSIRQADTTWTYGQVVALAVALMQVLDSIGAIANNKFNKKAMNQVEIEAENKVEK